MQIHRDIENLKQTKRKNENKINNDFESKAGVGSGAPEMKIPFL